MNFNKAIFLFLLVNLSGLSYGQTSFKYGSISSDSIHINYNEPAKIKWPGFVIPGLLMGYGSLKVTVNKINNIDVNTRNSIYKYYPNFKTGSDNYLMWVPSASIYVMDAAKIKVSHSFKEHIWIDACSILIAGGTGAAIRAVTKNSSINGEKYIQFPSGHTTNAFRGAEIVHQELKQTNQLLSYSGYLIASGVGLLRLYNKDHLVTEVFGGAGLGIISTKLTYLLLNKLPKKRGRYF